MFPIDEAFIIVHATILLLLINNLLTITSLLSIREISIILTTSTIATLLATFTTPIQVFIQNLLALNTISILFIMEITLFTLILYFGLSKIKIYLLIKCRKCIEK